MHRTKTAARREAWSDPTNPFGRFSYRKSPPLYEDGDLEDGQGTGYSVDNFGRVEPLGRVETDDPTLSASANARKTDMRIYAPSQQAQTEPNAVSRKRATEPGDDVQFASTLSPSPTVTANDSSLGSDSKARPERGEKDEILRSGSSQQSNDETAPRKRGFAKFFGGRAQHRKEKIEKDHDNGKSKKKFTFANQIRATLFNSWINLLLICSPLGIILYYVKVVPVAIFVVNFIAIIPLAALLSFATEEIALRVGEVLGGLLNASFGNAVELIVSVIALVKNQTLIVQTSLIGSMLSNLLLVMGMCFFAGGWNRIEQEFNLTVAQTAASLLFLAVGALIIPTAFDEWAGTGSTDRTNSSAAIVPGVAALSRATSIMLLIVYACYLFFQLKSHAGMYNKSGDKNDTRKDIPNGKAFVKGIIPGKHRKARKARQAREADDVLPQQEGENGNTTVEPKDEPEEPQLHIWVAIGTLAASTVLVALNAEYLVDSINAITCGGGISKNFVGLILIPIVGNAAEHATALTVAIKDKMDLAIGVAVGSSMQIALLVLPFIVVLGWILGKNDMTLYFDGFQIAILFVAVLLVNYLIQDGKSHWLEGVLLMTLYIIIAVAAWYYPTAPGLSDCPT